MESIPEQNRQVPLQTIRGLWVVLSELMEKGHGDTAICRADSEIGPCSISSIELYDTTREVEQGVLPERLTFLFC